MEKLTIEQLAVYLPYKLYGTVKDEMNLTYITELDTLGDECMTFKSAPDVFWDYEYNTFLPHLYPISMLTKEITHGGRTFIPLVELAEIAGLKTEGYSFLHDMLKLSDGLVFYLTKSISFNLTSGTRQFMVPNQFKLFQKLAEWHFNFIGIPEELYIDKSTLK